MVSGIDRLCRIADALDEIAIPFLVMGGHAVRHYGVDRNTADYDLHLQLDDWDRLPDQLRRSEWFAATLQEEGSSWRRNVFRRFLIGRLDDGREEWLEFWKANHLLAPFDELAARREFGEYGRRWLPFLSLGDLIRSKETERASDWQDIALLEEIQDSRNIANATDDLTVMIALEQLRSRSGFEQCLQRGLFANSQMLAAAFAETAGPITRAFLLPFVAARNPLIPDEGIIGEVLSVHLKTVAPSHARHLALVEAIRRLYKRVAMTADRADKLAARDNQEKRP